MPLKWKAKELVAKLDTYDTVFAKQLKMLSPVEQMEFIEQMAEAMSIDLFPPVSLRKAGEVKELDIEDWKKRTGYKTE